jgi:uncharacterized protein
MANPKETTKNPNRLTSGERAKLLELARQALEDIIQNGEVGKLNLDELPARLRQEGASFVTLTIHGELRGCMGVIEPQQPLAEDVRQHAISAAIHDPRFPPVTLVELPEIKIEISYLTPIQPLNYSCPEDLISSLRPGVDGVLLRDGHLRATFLPQVWEKIPEPEKFLGLLCQKMGVSPDYWQANKLDVSVYQVEEFHE